MQHSIHDLTLSSFEQTPIWETIDSDVGEGVDVSVAPLHWQQGLTGLERSPWVRASGALADGTKVMAIVNVAFDPPELLLPTLYVAGTPHSFYLPPAPDFVLAEYGPEALAKALNRGVESVFPFSLTSDVAFQCTHTPITMKYTVQGAHAA